MVKVVLIVCGKAPRRLVTVPAIRHFDGYRCAYCGELVKVVTT